MDRKRLRPVTYAESIVAKEYAEKIEQKVQPKPQEIAKTGTSLNSVKIDNLPSGGQTYPENAEIYFTPLSFGEMKFLSGSSLSDPENITFFLKKMQATFPVEDLTYYDFYFLSVMIKIATFGEIEYNMTFECIECGHVNKIPFNITDLAFDEIRVPLPIKVDLKEPYKDTETDTERSEVIFAPITIGRYKKMLVEGTSEDYDIYMSNCIKDGSEPERLTLIKEYLNGISVSLLETIDVSLYHGVQDLKMKCENQILTNAEREGACK